jgi:perosamine synthetase
MRKPVSSDFRYDTGEAKVPWTAVGEVMRHEDVMNVLKFLMPCHDAPAYARQLARVEKEVAALWGACRPASKLSLSRNVTALEAAARKFLGAKHALFTANATAGFEIGYRYANLGPGDEVIAPAITFIATISYPLAVGAKVVLADVDPATLNMDPADVARKVTKKTKVIIPVHIGGYPVDMAPIMKLARARDITVIEDAAHAFGATYRGRTVGTIGHFGAFSFHEVKNINSLGEGGLLVSNLPFGKDFAKARFLGVDPSRQIPNWLYDVVALQGKYGPFAANNSSTTEVQAVALLSQMKRLKRVIAARRRAAQYLTRRFSKVKGIVLPPAETDATTSTWHLYPLQIDPQVVGADIQALKAKLTARGVVQIPHFAPLYKFSIMRQLGYDTKAMQAGCPQAEEVFNHRFTHLPIYEFTPPQLKILADAVVDSVNELKAGR